MIIDLLPSNTVKVIFKSITRILAYLFVVFFISNSATARLALNCPDDKIEPACQSQNSINTSFTAWLASVEVTGTCNPAVSYGNPTPPSYCGGSVVVTFTATNECNETLTCSAVYSVSPAPSLTLSCPADLTFPACQTQADINNSYVFWLSSVFVNGGCNSSLTTTNAIAPSFCGGSSLVIFTASSSCQLPVTCSSRFTVLPPDQVALSCPENQTIPCLSQPAININYNTWLSNAVFSGGCGATLSNNSSGAPTCGSSQTVTFTVTDYCHQTVTCQSDFTINNGPLTLNCPPNQIELPCQSQQTINSQFNAWISSAQINGGCSPVISNNNVTAPSSCGGSATVKFIVTDLCNNFLTCTSIFSVSPGSPVAINCPGDITIPCASQASINASYISWLNSAVATGGCNPVLTNNSTGIPGCGSSTTITFTAYDNCNNPVNCQSTFTVENGSPIPLVLNCPANRIITSCRTQSVINTNYNAWLASAVFSGGCRATLTNNSTGAPSSCGGSTTVIFTVSDFCGSIVTCAATYTVESPSPKILNCPSDQIEQACRNQATINKRYNTWLGSVGFTGGCNALLSHNSTGAPSPCGGTSTVIFTLTDICSPPQTCSAKFIVEGSPVVLNCPPSVIEAACQKKSVIKNKYNAWLASAGFTGGCNATISNNSTSIPSECGDSRTVTFTVTSSCQSPVTCEATFTVEAAPALTLICPVNRIEQSCQTQAMINAKYAAWLATATYTGGCNVNMVTGNANAPSACGGTSTVIFTVSSSCGTATHLTCTASFTVDFAPQRVTLVCPPDVIESGCQSPAVIEAKFNAWLNSASLIGGCGVITNNNISITVLPGSQKKVKFKLECVNQTSCQSTFTVTAPLNANVVTSHVACFGGNNGSAVPIVTGGSLPYQFLWTPGNRTTQTITGLTAGNYSLQVTDAIGCIKQKSFIINQPLEIVNFFTSTGPVGGPYTDLSHVSGGTPPYNYLWLPAGSTTPSESGHLPNNTYSIRVIDSKSCQKLFSISHPQRLSFEEDQRNESIVSDILFYPNPTSGKVIAEFISSGNEKYKFNILDLLGKEIDSKELTSEEGINRIDFDFENLTPGIYFIRLSVNNRSEVYKIIFQP